MAIKEKSNLRIEALDKKFRELFLENKKIQKQNKELFLQNKSLEQQIKVSSDQNIKYIESNLWFKYCNEVNRIYINCEKKILSSKFLHRSSIFLLSLFPLEFLLSLNYSFPKFHIIFYISYLFILLSIILSPFFIAFFNLKIYLKLKNPKNYLKIITLIYKKINITFQTFWCILSSYTTVYLVSGILTLSFIKDPRVDSRVLENYGFKTYIIFIIPFIFTIKSSENSVKGYLQTINPKWAKYKFNVFYYMGTFVLILFFFLDAFTSGLPEINIAAQEELKKYDLACEVKAFIDIIYSKLLIKHLILAYIFHFISHLVSEYFIDKQYIEEHNILPLH